MSLAVLLAAAASTPASAAEDTDRAHLWVRHAAAVAGWPSGALSDTRVQVRTPLRRTDSVLFQDTTAGVGARTALTPAFAEAGAHATLAPIAIFDVDLFAGGVTYWPGAFGPRPTDHRGDTLPGDSDAAGFDRVGTSGLVVSANPTLKAKVGRVIVFDSWTVRHQRLAPGAAAPWVIEPYTDLVLGWTDTVIEHQPGVLVDIIPDEGAAWLRVGGTMRDRRSRVTEDRSLSAGGLVAMKTGAKPGAPTFAGMALAYAVDDDRVGLAPYLGLQASWQWTRGLRAEGPRPAGS